MPFFSRLLLIIFPLIFVFSCHEREHQTPLVKYEMNPDEDAYVVVLFKGEDVNQTQSRRELMIRRVVGQIRESDRIHQFDYQISSSTFNDADRVIPYIVVRGMIDFDAAETAARLYSREMRVDIRKTIQTPFPISQTNYLSCVNAGDFSQYLRYDTSRRKQ